MKNISLFAACTCAFLASCTPPKTPEYIFKQAKETLFEFDSFEYISLAMYPNPMNEYDTSYFYVSFEKNASSIIGYNVIGEKRGAYRNSDFVYLDGTFRHVKHNDLTIEYFTEEDSTQERFNIKNDHIVNYSPITYFEQTDWNFVSDTVINNKKYSNFIRIEQDRLNDYGERVLTEQHIYIDKSSYLVEKFERRNYYKGALSQVVIYEYQDYTFEEADEMLSYFYPLGYTTVQAGVSPYANLLEVGDKAPDFTVTDEDTREISLSDYLGKKVLLDFSIINCGYCLESLEHFNSEGYQLSDDVIALYVNPLDSKDQMTNFAEEFTIPFPVVIDGAQEMAKNYGVATYPLFYLIDEEGYIEEVIRGFDQEFQEGLGS